MSVKPDFSGRGIVNLMSSIGSAVGFSSPYVQLEGEIHSRLQESRNIILLIVDGLGFNYLKRDGKGTLLERHLKQDLTSVFPPTTATAMSTYYSGLAPQQHALTGWWVYLREYGLVSRILGFSNVVDWNTIETDISNVIDTELIFRVTEKTHSLVMPERLTDSVFTNYISGNSKMQGYSDLDNLFDCLAGMVTSKGNGNFIQAYWPEFDAISHLLGVSSDEAKQHLHEIDSVIKGFTEKIQGTDTTLLVTSDHGFHDTQADSIIHTRDHPELESYLSLPLCGDTRAAYCYVRASEVEHFERYISENLDHACSMRKSKDLISENWFGLFEPNPKLFNRVGDYTLFLKEKHAMLNTYPGLESPNLVGHHGGTTEDEMLVPLVVIDC
ncbi:MAG: alkaline phosphatase family protein [Candidatus Thorarchaeota archaeon]|jgi:hypothetical protein